MLGSLSKKEEKKKEKRGTYGANGEGERDLVEDPGERFEEPPEIEDFCYGGCVDEAGEDVGEGY